MISILLGWPRGLVLSLLLLLSLLFPLYFYVLGMAASSRDYRSHSSLVPLPLSLFVGLLLVSLRFLTEMAHLSQVAHAVIRLAPDLAYHSPSDFTH